MIEYAENGLKIYDVKYKNLLKKLNINNNINFFLFKIEFNVPLAKFFDW